MDRLCLTTHAGNREALRFYRHQGCRVECCGGEETVYLVTIRLQAPAGP